VPHNRHISHDHVDEGSLCIDGVSFRYPDGTLALEDVNLHVARGRTLAVVGPNGAGKTTLLKILLGLLDGYEGRVRVEGLPPDEARHRGVATWVPQRSDLNTAFPITIRQLVRLGLIGRTGLLRGYRRDDLDYVERLHDRLELAEIADRPIGRVSGGQLQRALVARALAPKPQVLLLDEPFTAIDAAGQERFHNLLESVKQEFGVTLVIVSHDLRTMLTRSQRIACLARTLHFHDLPERLTPDVLSHVFHYDLDGVPIPHAGHDEHRDRTGADAAGTDPPEGGDA
jgi:zinc transport system ATP-binding protein